MELFGLHTSITDNAVHAGSLRLPLVPGRDIYNIQLVHNPGQL